MGLCGRRLIMSFTYNDVYGTGFLGCGARDSVTRANTYRKKGKDKLSDWTLSSILQFENSTGYVVSNNIEKTTSNAVIVNAISVASVKDMVEIIQKIFGLNLSQIAKITGISRATIYNHLNDESASVDNYIDFYRLSVEVESHFGCVANVLKNILVSDRTLLRHLECSYKNKELIMSVIEKIKDYKPNKSADYGSISDQKRSNMVYVVGK